MLLIDEAGNELPKDLYRRWQPYSGRIFEQLLRHDAMVATPSVVVRRGLVADCGGFDESLRFCQDYELWLRLARRSEVHAISQPLVKIRLHPTSRTYDRPEVSEAFYEIYRRTALVTASAESRRICRRQCAFYKTSYADHMARRGQYRRAITALWSAVRLRPLSLRPWRVLAKHLFRTLFRARGASR